jgi:hypothetical protein
MEEEWVERADSREREVGGGGVGDENICGIRKHFIVWGNRRVDQGCPHPIYHEIK